MKTILASAGLVASTFLASVSPVTPAMALQQEFCEGNAYYCEQFAYNCTVNNGRFVNLRPGSTRHVSYACELPAGVSADLFESNLAGTLVPSPGGDNDNHSDNSDNDSGNDNSSSDDGPGGNPGGGGGSGTTGGDDGQGNIL